MFPEERVDEVCPGLAYICDAGIGQLAIPLVLDAGDLAGLVEDVDLAGDCSLFAYALDFVKGRHVHLDGVAGGGDAVGFALDFGEGGLEAVLVLGLLLVDEVARVFGARVFGARLIVETTYPLRLKLLPALGYGDGVGEDGVVLPELQLGERWSAREQVKHRGDKSSLLAAEVDAGCGLDVGVFELELAGVGGRHACAGVGGRSRVVPGREVSDC